MSTETHSKISLLGRTPQLPSRVANVISAEIAEGRLRQGDRLPTEQALAERFGVSRSVIREAVARLRSDGLVQSRQGVGVFVVGSEEAGTLRIDADLLSDRTVFQNVFELRAILEIRASGLAAARATDEQLAMMTEAFERMCGVAKWEEGGVTADLDFHRAIAAASGNSYIASIVGMLTAQMRQSIMFMRQNIIDPAKHLTAMNIAEHAAIHDAILQRNPQEARAAMRAHITAAAERLGYPLHDEVLRSEDFAVRGESIGEASTKSGLP